MKKFIYAFMILAICFNYSFSFNSGENDNSQNQEIIILNSSEEGKAFENSKEISLKLTSSLNYATKKTIKAEAIKMFKKMASEKGYTHLYIDEELSGKKHNEIRKRNYTIVIQGIAFKN
jgi:hypothetical protein